MRLGDLRVEVAPDGAAYMPSWFFGDADTPEHQAIAEPDGRLRLPIATFVVFTGAKVVLLDAGFGPWAVDYEPDPARPGTGRLEGGELPASLAALGLTPADVDLVLLSHVHMDHSGWVWRDGAPFFPNATVRFGRGDWDLYVEQGVVGADGPGLRALADLGRVDLIDGDGVEVAPGITARHTPGHTPGHQIYVVASQGERALFLGDAVSCPIQLDTPSLDTVADVDPKLGITTRERILREITGDDLVGGPHFPGLRFGRMVVGEGRRYWS